MNIEFDKSFFRSLDKLADHQTIIKVQSIISQIEVVKSINDIRNIKKLRGYPDYYRIKIGSYRIGFEYIKESTIRFIIISHRKDFYRKFPL